MAANAQFAEIVNDTSSDVDLIFNGHTHQAYAFQAPVPGEPGETRPIVQAGNYGTNLGKVVVTYDQDADEIISTTASVLPLTTVPNATLISTYPRVFQVNQIVQAAIAAAAVVGNQPVGSVAADITTAYSGGAYTGPGGVYAGGGRDDRASESTLGDLVADALLDTLDDPLYGSATIGMVNPGGLRAELLYAPDGVVTYAEANGVLPFVNNLWTTSLTGAQFKAVLEQQWQTNPDGTVPLRSYLQLGLSSNVTYTFDPAAARGSHITSITIDGQPIDPTASYRIGTFSFLATGGDNFREFANGTEPDRHGAHRPRRVDRVPAGEPEPGARLRAPGGPGAAGADDGRGRRDADLPGRRARPHEPRLAAEHLARGAARTACRSEPRRSPPARRPSRATIPAGTTAGAHVLTLVATPSGTTVTLPITVEASLPESVTTLQANRTTLKTGTGQQARLTAKVEVGGAPATGQVEFVVDGAVVSTVALDNKGVARYDLSATPAASSRQVVARYLGTSEVAASESAPLTIVTERVKVRLDLRASQSTQRQNAIIPTIFLATAVPDAAALPDGTVEIREGSTVITRVRMAGRRVGLATLPRGQSLGVHHYTAVFIPSDPAKFDGATSAPVTVTIVK